MTIHSELAVGATYDTAVGDETAEVESAIASSSALEGLFDDLIVVELALLDCLVDAHNILPDNPACSDVQVSNLGIAHQALGQAHRQRRGFKFRKSVCVLGELVHDGSLSGGNGVAILGALLGGDTPAINDDCTSAKAKELATPAQGRGE